MKQDFLQYENNNPQKGNSCRIKRQDCRNWILPKDNALVIKMHIHNLLNSLG